MFRFVLFEKSPSDLIEKIVFGRPLVLTSIFLVLLFSACDPAKKTQEATLQNTASKTFSINFIQNDQRKPIKNNQVRLKKEPFTIEIDVNDLPGVFVLADFAADDKFRGDNEFDNLQHVAPKTMAEETNNKNNELLINSKGYGYWFYNPNVDWHRYNVVAPKKEKGFVGTKNVNRFSLIQQQDIIDIKDAPDDLYLFFFSMEGSFELGHRVIQRSYIQVKWK